MKADSPKEVAEAIEARRKRFEKNPTIKNLDLWLDAEAQLETLTHKKYVRETRLSINEKPGGHY